MNDILKNFDLNSLILLNNDKNLIDLIINYIFQSIEDGFLEVFNSMKRKEINFNSKTNSFFFYSLKLL